MTIVDQKCCVHWFSKMCPIVDDLHRYTRLVWDAERKTILGKNGVSWLSIVFGTLVVIFGLGVFIQCVREVRKSRQENETQIRKMLLEKRKVPPSNVHSSILKAGKGSSKVSSTSSPSFSAVNERPPLANESEVLDYLRERDMLVRKRRNSLTFTATTTVREIGKTRLNKNNDEQKVTEASTLPSTAYKGRNEEKKRLSNINEQANNKTKKPSNATDESSKMSLDAATTPHTFLEKLATAKFDRAQNKRPIFEILEQMLNERPKKPTPLAMNIKLDKAELAAKGKEVLKKYGFGNYICQGAAEELSSIQLPRSSTEVIKKTTERQNMQTENPETKGEQIKEKGTILSTFENFFNKRRFKDLKGSISTPNISTLEDEQPEISKKSKLTKLVDKITSLKVPPVIRRTNNSYDSSNTNMDNKIKPTSSSSNFTSYLTNQDQKYKIFEEDNFSLPEVGPTLPSDYMLVGADLKDTDLDKKNN